MNDINELFPLNEEIEEACALLHPSPMLLVCYAYVPEVDSTSLQVHYHPGAGDKLPSEMSEQDHIERMGEILEAGIEGSVIFRSAFMNIMNKKMTQLVSN